MGLQELQNEATATVSTSTIWHVLAAEGYHCWVARKVPYLTKAHKRARLAWAKRNKGMEDEDWQQVIFSNECYIYLGDTQGHIFVTQWVDEVLLDECLVPTFKQSSVHIMVWGCIIEGRKGPLVVLEYPGGKGGGMNSTRYQDQVLEPTLKAFYKQMNHERQNVHFQQDSAASHRSKSTMKWFTDNQIPLFHHPASSPDLNPIEPVWLDLKNILSSHTHPQHC